MRKMKNYKLFPGIFITTFIIIAVLSVSLTGCIGSRPPRYTIAETEDKTERNGENQETEGHENGRTAELQKFLQQLFDLIN